MGKVAINCLQIKCIIGTLEHERVTPQKVILDLEFEYDASLASATDDLTGSVDYSAVERAVVSLVSNSSFFLLEKLAGAVAEKVLEFDGVTRVKVSITKPGASAYGAVISFTDEYRRQ